MSVSSRRSFVSKVPAVAAAVAVPGALALGGRGRDDHDDPDQVHERCRSCGHGPCRCAPTKEVHWIDGEPEGQPLFSPVVTFGNLVFISGIGAHFEGDIRQHTDHVLNEVERYLEAVGSSMEKVLKATVHLATLDDYDGMNEVFLGRFGLEPGVRTTTAVAGVPGDSLVEIDVVACI
jgi:2-iminobutanoate/2-iminopropanoate deaminase